MKYFTFLVSIFLSFSFFELKAEEPSLERLFINKIPASPSMSIGDQIGFRSLMMSLSGDSDGTHPELFHLVKSINLSTSEVVLMDGSVFQIGWWYTGGIKKWVEGSKLKICYFKDYSNNVYFENLEDGSYAWGVFKELPDHDLGDVIVQISTDPKDPDGGNKIVLKSDFKLKAPNDFSFKKSNWKVDDSLFIFHSIEDNLYIVWNITQNHIVRKWTLIGKDQKKNEEIVKKSTQEELRENIKNEVLLLEGKLNQRILSQYDATSSVAASFMNYCSGLKEPQVPISVFLFLGPTGVGKTELAKALTDILFKNRQYLTRFDMSHFTESYSHTRLIGTPPGYVNHEEGGQLTEALKEKPLSVVLLDEIEKAHPQVIKLFLPVFDEGYITDTKDKKIPCNQVVFIMTSNICADEISSLFDLGYNSQEILREIEPKIIKILSPELYNRVEPIIFRPLSMETMIDLVDLMLKDIILRLKSTKDIDLEIDDTVREYLIRNGFHSSLGARPLKRLIEKKVVAALSHAIIYDNIDVGSKIMIFYSEADDSWNIDYQ